MRKEDSIHATYLLYGYHIEERTKPNAVNGGGIAGQDGIPHSSPLSSSAPYKDSEKAELELTSVTLTKEENLISQPLFLTFSYPFLIPYSRTVEAKSGYKKIISIHVYSLERAALQVRDDIDIRQLRLISHEPVGP